VACDTTGLGVLDCNQVKGELVSWLLGYNLINRDSLTGEFHLVTQLLARELRRINKAS